MILYAFDILLCFYYYTNLAQLYFHCLPVIGFPYSGHKSYLAEFCPTIYLVFDLLLRYLHSSEQLSIPFGV